MLFRIDLLPRRRGGGFQGEAGAVGEGEAEAGIEWLVSEVEGQWCQMFLRAAAAAATPAVVESIVTSVVARQTGGARAGGQGQGAARQVKRRRLGVGSSEHELGVSEPT